MNKNLNARIASFALAALMTLGMLGSVNDIAKAEYQLGATSALMAQAGQQAVRA